MYSPQYSLYIFLQNVPSQMNSIGAHNPKQATVPRGQTVEPKYRKTQKYVFKSF